MQYRLLVDVEIEESEPRLTVKEVGEPCEVCCGVGIEDAKMRIGVLVERWCEEVGRLDGTSYEK